MYFDCKWQAMKPGDPVALLSRRALLVSTVAVEGAIFLAAALLLWLTGLSPELSATPSHIALGATVGLVMAVCAAPLMRADWVILRRLRKDFDLVIALFSKSSWIELALFSLLAGVAEETLFRGVMQTWLEPLAGPTVAIVAVAVVFGLVHAISRPYVIFAFVLGLILGALFYFSRSLAAAMTAHAVYDFAALLYGTRVVARHRVAAR